DRFDAVRLRRWDEVVEQAAAPGEALDAEELFRVERPVRSAVLRVALARHAASLHVEHRRLASRRWKASLSSDPSDYDERVAWICARAAATNSALLFALPQSPQPRSTASVSSTHVRSLRESSPAAAAISSVNFATVDDPSSAIGRTGRGGVAFDRPNLRGRG